MTYNNERDPTAQHQPISRQHTIPITALDDPLRDRDFILPLLRSIRIPIFRQIVPSHLVGQGLVRLGEFYKLGVCVALRLVLSQPDLVRVTIPPCPINMV